MEQLICQQACVAIQLCCTTCCTIPLFPFAFVFSALVYVHSCYANQQLTRQLAGVTDTTSYAKHSEVQQGSICRTGSPTCREYGALSWVEARVCQCIFQLHDRQVSGNKLGAGVLQHTDKTPSRQQQASSVLVH